MSFLETASSIGGQLMNTFVLFFVSLVGIGIGVGAYFLIKKARSYNYTTYILQPDGTGGLHLVRDKGGVILDMKTNNKRFFLKDMKVGLDPDNVPFVAGPKGERIVFLLRKGLKNFEFIKFNLQDQNFLIDVGEEDVNWSLNAFERAKKAIIQQNKLLQMIPWIALAIFSVTIMIVILYLFKYAGEIAPAMEHVAQALANSGLGGGTRVV